MRAFYLAYRTPEIVAQPVRQIAEGAPPESVAHLPWGHNVVLFQKVKDADQRLWYAAKTLEHGWSRAVLAVQIETDLYRRQGQAVTNFASTLPPPQSDLAQQALKDPYLFDFLTLHDDTIERDLETGLVDHIQKFLVELGAGFAFVGRQVHLTVGDDDFYLDLLFYHLNRRRRMANPTGAIAAGTLEREFAQHRGNRSRVGARRAAMNPALLFCLEDHISQIPALQLLQNLGWGYLTPGEAVALRGGKLGNVLLEAVLVEQYHSLSGNRQ